MAAGALGSNRQVPALSGAGAVVVAAGIAGALVAGLDGAAVPGDAGALADVPGVPGVAGLDGAWAELHPASTVAASIATGRRNRRFPDLI